MQNDTALSVKTFDSPKKLGLRERLEAVIAEHPGATYHIFQEEEAAELLMILGLTMKKQAKVLSKPIDVTPENERLAKPYNQKQLAMVKAMGNKFVKAARSGEALQFCKDELQHPPLEYMGLTISFEAVSSENT